MMTTPPLKDFIAQTVKDVCDAIESVRRDRAASPNKASLFGSKDALPAIDFDLAVAVDPTEDKTKIIVLGSMSSDHPSVPLVAAPGPSRIKFRLSLTPEAEGKRDFAPRSDRRDDDRPRREPRFGGGEGGDRDRGDRGDRPRSFRPDRDRDAAPRKRSFGDEGRPGRRFD
ncbi:MAG: hypothetical protein ACKO43_02295 [Alphaproteobacteria bacterium]